MTVQLTNNFFLNSRGLTLADSGGIAWSLNKNTNTVVATGTAGAVLSSVGLSDNSTTPIYTVGSSPLLANGTLTLTLKTQSPAFVFAGPVSGGAAQPTFRALQATDIPTLAYVTSVGSTSLTIGGTGAAPTVNLSSTQIANIAAGGTALQSVTTADSIQGSGTGGSPVELIGDSAAPGGLKYYGTNASGTRGWYASLASANPSASISLTAVNGSAATFMTSDSAPALSQAITPVWTGAHVFTNTVAIRGPGQIALLGSTTAAGSYFSFQRNSVVLSDIGSADAVVTSGSASDMALGSRSGALVFSTNSGTLRMTIANSGAVTITGTLAINNGTPTAALSGFGSPTGSVTSGLTNGATLAQTAGTLAALLAYLKTIGFIAA